MEQLTFTKKDGSDYILLTLSGDFNAYTAQNIQSEIYSTIEKTNLVLDLANVNVLDAAAMGIIMAAHNDAEEYSKRLSKYCQFKIIEVSCSTFFRTGTIKKGDMKYFCNRTI